MTQEKKFNSILIKYTMKRLFIDDNFKDIIKDLEECSLKYNKVKRLNRKNIISDFNHFALRLEILMENNNEQIK